MVVWEFPCESRSLLGFYFESPLLCNGLFCIYNLLGYLIGEYMDWSTTLTWEDAKKKAEILSKIRQFFANRDVIEVETPLLCDSTVTDLHLEPFKTSFEYDSDLNATELKYKFLQTSPEFCMKRLLASGYQSIYQISKAFRHEAKGRLHNPEFTILEWYRIGFTQRELMDEVSDLFITVLNCKQPIFITYQNVFIKYTSIDPLNCSIKEVLVYIEENNKMSDWLLFEKNISTLLQFVLSEFIEPIIDHSVPHFIYDFPVDQASLAKVNKSNPKVAERFECYYQGLELVNGFSELTDYKEQFERFNNDNKERKKCGLEEKNIDERFINALKSGIPECSGVAMGVDRLLMIALNKNDIDGVITFCIDRA